MKAYPKSSVSNSGAISAIPGRYQLVHIRCDKIYAMLSNGKHASNNEYIQNCEASGKGSDHGNIGDKSEKLFTATMDEKKPKKVIGQYIKIWGIETFHKKLKHYWLRHLYHGTHVSLPGTTKLNPRVSCFFKPLTYVPWNPILNSGGKYPI